MKASLTYFKFIFGITFAYTIIKFASIYIFDWPILYHNILYKNIRSMFIYLLIYIFYTQFIFPSHKKGRFSMSFHKQLLLALFIISTSLLCVAAYLFNATATSVNTSLLVVILIFISILLFSLILVISSRFLEQERERYLLEQRLQKQLLDLTYYEDVSNALLQVSKLRHDFKNHLIIICDFIEHNESAKALEYIQRISNLSHSAVEEVFTNNNTISAVLNIKRRECQKLHIPFTLDLCFPKIHQLEDIHIVAILGNLLDNAIAATSKLAESERNLSLSIRQIDTYLEIICINTFNGIVKLDHNGKFVTTHDTQNKHHGFGLLNIQDTVSKYEGDFNINYDNTTFTVRILIPNHD